jgi:hypothetical protein
VNRPNNNYRHGFVVVRIDTPVDQAHPEDSISVLKIFPTQEAADAERERLSRINAGKNCFYFVAERHTTVESNYRAAVNAIDLHLSINSNGENSPTLLSTQSKTLKIERCGMKYFVELELSRRQTLFE